MLDKCKICGAEAHILAGPDSLCFQHAEMERKQRKADVLAGHVKWGRWRFRSDNLTIEHDDGYYIDLERCQDSIAALDWIAQVSAKGLRYSAEDVGQLVRAMDELIDLQGTFCGGGKNGKLDAVARFRPKTS